MTRNFDAWEWWEPMIHHQEWHGGCRTPIRKPGLYWYMNIFLYRIILHIPGILPNCGIFGTIGIFRGSPKTVHSRCSMYRCNITLSGTSVHFAGIGCCYCSVLEGSCASRRCQQAAESCRADRDKNRLEGVQYLDRMSRCLSIGQQERGGHQRLNRAFRGSRCPRRQSAASKSARVMLMGSGACTVSAACLVYDCVNDTFSCALTLPYIAIEQLRRNCALRVFFATLPLLPCCRSSCSSDIFRV